MEIGDLGVYIHICVNKEPAIGRAQTGMELLVLYAEKSFIPIHELQTASDYTYCICISTL